MPQQNFRKVSKFWSWFTKRPQNIWKSKKIFEALYLQIDHLSQTVSRNLMHSGITHVLARVRYRTIQGCRKAHQFQLIINDGQINRESVMFRYSPCNCLPSTISCSQNANCKKYANLSAEKNPKIAKQRFWTVHKLVKIVQTDNSDTMQSYNNRILKIFRKWLQNAKKYIKKIDAQNFPKNRDLSNLVSLGGQ